MNNVGPQFEMTVSSAQARENPITYDDLEALLLSAERRHHEQNQPLLDTTPTALHASRNRGSGRGFPFGRRGGARGRPFLSNPSNFGRGSPRSSSSILGPGPSHLQSQFSQGGGSPFFGTKLICQICSRPGHTALDCFNRLNLSYEGKTPSKKLTAMAAQHVPSDPSATWLSDSGANTHITSDLNNIANPTEL